MKIYERPTGMVEQFGSNDYVTACYTVKCLIGQGAQGYGTPFYNTGSHRNEYHWTGTLPAGAIGTDKMKEDEKAQKQLGHCFECGDNTVLNDNGTVYENFKGSSGGIGDGVVLKDDVNKYICWYTDDVNGSGRYWHVGQEIGVDSNHPNMS